MKSNPPIPTVQSGLALTGLAADNPLAFLAAIGLLRVLNARWPDRSVRMSWVGEGGWHPLLSATPSPSRSEVVQELDSALVGRGRAPEFTLVESEDQEPREIKLPPKEFAEVANCAAQKATKGDRTWADFCAAFGSEAYQDELLIRETDFHFTSGQQSFLGSIRELASDPPRASSEEGTGTRSRKPAKKDVGGATTVAHLDHALFGPWSYSDPRPSMRWDPVDDRRYALRAFDPTNASASPIMTVRGANRLAIEGLPWFPVFPCSGDAETRGFSRSERALWFVWPIWQPPISADTVRSLLGLAELYKAEQPRATLQARGVLELFRSRRIGGYYRNFAPAAPSWGRSALFSVDAATRRS